MQLLRSKRIAYILAFLIAVMFIPTASYAATLKADDIKYDTDAGEELDFDEDNFNAVCDDLTGETLRYVKFNPPSSSKGVLYYDDEEVDDGDRYYYDDDPSIDDITFVPKSGYSGTVTISYSGRDTDGNDFTGDIKISVEDDDSDADDITYTVDSNDTVDFDEGDFNDVCQDLNDEDLVYVKFSSLSSSKGVLYYDYDGRDEDTVGSGKYYYDDDPSIDDITFVPKSSYTGTVTISYTALDEDDNSYSGTVKITVKDSGESGDINYSVNASGKLEFNEEDFNDFCEDENDETLDYIKFTPPAAAQGILYYDYDGDDEDKVSSSDKYYYDDDPAIEDLTFIPNKNYSGEFSIKFTGYDTEGDSIEGAVAITVTGGNLKSANVISYAAKPGSTVYFKDSDFNNACTQLMKNALDHVTFTLPSSSAGKLYYGYTSSKNYTSEVSATAKYYYGTTPYLLNVVFVPAGNAPGSATIAYTGYDTEGAAYKGTIQITFSETGTAVGALKKSKYFKDVDEAYSWAVDYIDNLYDAGIVSGTTVSGTTKNFNPASKITRGEFMLMLYRTLGMKSNTSSGNFSDVPKGSYYYDAIATAKALGIAQGSENKFYPNSSVTREDTMVLALRAMNKNGRTVASADTGTLSVYSDNHVISSYAKESIAALIKAGIITGSDDNKIHPMETITRAEASAIIYRIKN